MFSFEHASCAARNRFRRDYLVWGDREAAAQISGAIRTLEKTGFLGWTTIQIKWGTYIWNHTVRVPLKYGCVRSPLPLLKPTDTYFWYPSRAPQDAYCLARPFRLPTFSETQFTSLFLFLKSLHDASPPR